MHSADIHIGVSCDYWTTKLEIGIFSSLHDVMTDRLLMSMLS